MANYETLKANIAQVITTNGNNEITGAILQSLLISIVTSLGDGYQYKGIAKLNTNPGTPDQKVFYLATRGTYVNFDNKAVTTSVGVLKYDGTWTVEGSQIANLADVVPMIPAKLGKNLFDRNGYISGYFINASGNLQANASYGVSNYFPVGEETPVYISYSGSGNAGASTVRVAYYDAGLNLISTEAMGKKAFTTPVGTAYMRISHYLTNTSNLQIEVGTERTTYEPYNPFFGYPLVSDDLLNALDAKKVTVRTGKNLFDKVNIESGYYLHTNGTLRANASYGVSNYFPISGGSTLFISYSGTGAVGAGTVSVGYYDANLNLLSTETMGKKTFVTPEGASFMRISFYLNTINSLQIEIGTERTTYEPYNPIAGYSIIIPDNAVTTLKIADNAVTYEKLSAGVRALIESGGGGSGSGTFQGSRVTGAILAGGILKTPVRAHIRKNVFLSAKIGGAITLVRVGVGGNTEGVFRESYAYWVEVTPTTVSLYRYDGSADVLINSYAHGLNLGQNTVVEVYSNQSTTALGANLRIYDDVGGVYSSSLSGNWGVGTPFVQNGNASASLDVVLSFMPRDITKKIWLFGDSYIDLSWNGRWPYYLANQNLINYFINAKSGLSPAEGLADLQSVLTLGHIPTYLFWALGMNGPGTEQQVDGEYVINPEQKTVIDSVVSICEDAHINLVLATIPTVPNFQKTGYSSYVRGLGYRYVDFARAVNANSSGEWTPGLLSSDQVHPTAAGAAVLASQVLVDFPEISLSV